MFFTGTNFFRRFVWSDSIFFYIEESARKRAFVLQFRRIMTPCDSKYRIKFRRLLPVAIFREHRLRTKLESEAFVCTLGSLTRKKQFLKVDLLTYSNIQFQYAIQLCLINLKVIFESLQYISIVGLFVSKFRYIQFTFQWLIY